MTGPQGTVDRARVHGSRVARPGDAGSPGKVLAILVALAVTLAACRAQAAPSNPRGQGRLRRAIADPQNGVRVLLIPDPHATAVSVGLWVEAGPRYERPGMIGLRTWPSTCPHAGSTRPAMPRCGAASERWAATPHRSPATITPASLDAVPRTGLETVLQLETRRFAARPKPGDARSGSRHGSRREPRAHAAQPARAPAAGALLGRLPQSPLPVSGRRHRRGHHPPLAQGLPGLPAHALHARSPVGHDRGRFRSRRSGGSAASHRGVDRRARRWASPNRSQAARKPPGAAPDGRRGCPGPDPGGGLEPAVGRRRCGSARAHGGRALGQARLPPAAPRGRRSAGVPVRARLAGPPAGCHVVLGQWRPCGPAPTAPRWSGI